MNRTVLILKLLRTINWNKLNCHSITYRWSENCSVSDYLQSHGYKSLEFSRPEYWSELAVTFSRLPSQPRDWTQVSHTGGRFFAIWATKGIQKFLNIVCVCVISCSVMSDSFAAPWTIAHQAPLSWNSPGKSTGVGCHFLLQGIFPTQGLNPCFLHWQADSWPQSHLGSPLSIGQLS